MKWADPSIVKLKATVLVHPAMIQKAKGGANAPAMAQNKNAHNVPTRRTEKAAFKMRSLLRGEGVAKSAESSFNVAIEESM